jgi:hypothetical protein
MNKSLKHDPFLDVFEAILKTKPFDEFESMILRKRSNIHHFVNKTLFVKKPATIDTLWVYVFKYQFHHI